jgi:hypothetical protein
MHPDSLPSTLPLIWQTVELIEKEMFVLLCDYLDINP